MAVTTSPPPRMRKRQHHRSGAVKAHHIVFVLLALVSSLLVLSYLHSVSLGHPPSHPTAGLLLPISNPRDKGAAAADAAAAAAAQRENQLRRAQSVAHQHREEHHQADAHIVEHWKDRGAQLVPRREDEEQQQQEREPHERQPNSAGLANDVDSKKFILFHGISSGQGAGNIISGLLAAHLYGDEFDRIVCLTTGMRNFAEAFEPVHPHAVRYCPLLQQRGLPPTNFEKNSFQVLTFEPPPNECKLKDLLQSGEQVLYMGGNTYPRWPVVPKDYFVRFYKPRPALQRYLPPPPQPRVVVHLRLEDGDQDRRKGLDPQSLEALGKFLARNSTAKDVPYLVTNHVEWFDYFSTKFGWRHPEWHVVTHSALAVHSKGKWGQRGTVNEHTDLNLTVQNLQMWSDWNTLLLAQTVYHTHSDFSISAIHWMDIDSRTIQGYDPTKGELVLEEESWRASWKEEGVTPPLRDRTIDGEGIAKLRCGNLRLNPFLGKGPGPDVIL
jgi:hypothetical protein